MDKNIDPNKRETAIVNQNSGSTLMASCIVTPWQIMRRQLLEMARNDPGLESGFTEIDSLTGGFRKTELIIVASRPSMGKTSFALNILANVAVKENNPCMMFSLEADREQQLNRLSAIVSGTDIGKLKDGTLTNKEKTQYKLALQRIKNSNLMIDDTPGITLSSIRSRCEKAMQEQALKMVVIDYLQLMGTDSPDADDHCENRVRELTEIVKGLKQLAMDIKCPVIVLMQAPEPVKKRSDKRPKLYDFKGMGEIKQTADTILFLYRDEYYNPNSPKAGEAEVDVAKQMYGLIGTVYLHWEPQTARFKDKGTGPKMSLIF